MSDEPTFCSDCDGVHPESRARPSYLWLCSQHPKLPGYTGFVTGEVWEKDEPFLRCKEVNGGRCKLFKPRRTPQLEMPT